jgi:hypothetical protein
MHAYPLPCNARDACFKSESPSDEGFFAAFISRPSDRRTIVSRVAIVTGSLFMIVSKSIPNWSMDEPPRMAARTRSG